MRRPVDPEMDQAASSGETFSEHRFIAYDKNVIFYRKVASQGQPKAILFLIHGLGEHGGRYLPSACFFSSLGIECWIPDLRGFGESGGKRGYTDGLWEYKADFKVLYGLAERAHAGVPIFLMGHSFGGLLTVLFLKQCRPVHLKGLILSSPLLGVALPIPIWQSLLAKTASLLLPTLTQNSGVKTEFLTHDPDMRLLREQDPLIHSKISARLYTEFLQGITEAFKTAPQIQTPMLILQAGDDRIVSKPKTQLFYQRLSSADKELHFYDGWYHELLNEVQRQAVFEKISGWLIKHI